MKVYCEGCAFLIWSSRCSEKSNFIIIKTYLTKIRDFGECLNLNRNNDCERYKDKTWKDTIRNTLFRIEVLWRKI